MNPTWIPLVEAQKKFPHQLAPQGIINQLHVLDHPEARKFVLVGEDRQDHDFSLLLFSYDSVGALAIKVSIETLEEAKKTALGMIGATQADLTEDTYTVFEHISRCGEIIDKAMAKGMTEEQAIQDLLDRMPGRPVNARTVIKQNLRAWRERQKTTS